MLRFLLDLWDWGDPVGLILGCIKDELMFVSLSSTPQIANFLNDIKMF
jgi:hypothetical protein